MSDTEVAGLRDAVQSMDLTTRRVLTLHYAEGLTPLEVALVLDLSERRVDLILAELRAFATARLGVGSDPLDEPLDEPIGPASASGDEAALSSRN